MYTVEGAGPLEPPRDGFQRVKPFFLGLILRETWYIRWEGGSGGGNTECHSLAPYMCQVVPKGPRV